LFVATFLTLIVVPTLYYMVARFGEVREQAVRRMKELYWLPYVRLAGEQRPDGEK